MSKAVWNPTTVKFDSCSFPSSTFIATISNLLFSRYLLAFLSPIRLIASKGLSLLANFPIRDMFYLLMSDDWLVWLVSSSLLYRTYTRLRFMIVGETAAVYALYNREADCCTFTYSSCLDLLTNVLIDQRNTIHGTIPIRSITILFSTDIIQIDTVIPMINPINT